MSNFFRRWRMTLRRQNFQHGKCSRGPTGLNVSFIIHSPKNDPLTLSGEQASKCDATTNAPGEGLARPVMIDGTPYKGPFGAPHDAFSSPDGHTKGGSKERRARKVLRRKKRHAVPVAAPFSAIDDGQCDERYRFHSNANPPGSNAAVSAANIAATTEPALLDEREQVARHAIPEHAPRHTTKRTEKRPSPLVLEPHGQAPASRANGIAAAPGGPQQAAPSQVTASATTRFTTGQPCPCRSCTAAAHLTAKYELQYWDNAAATHDALVAQLKLHGGQGCSALHAAGGLTTEILNDKTKAHDLILAMQLEKEAREMNSRPCRAGRSHSGHDWGGEFATESLARVDRRRSGYRGVERSLRLARIA